MTRSAVHRAAAATTALVLAGGAWPAAASAHGLVGRTDLPIPEWMFAWAAAIVLVVSFMLLGTLWPKPRLEGTHRRRLFALPAWLEPVAGIVGVLVFVLVVYAGLRGSSVATENLAPTWIYVIFWVGVPVLSVLFGDVFRPFNPWRAIARGTAWAARRAAPRLADRAPRRYPERLGRWPAIAVLLGFAWLELVYVDRDIPSRLAWLSLAYAAVQLGGMWTFGIEKWTERADGFSVYFNLVSRLAPIESRERAVWLRPPVAGVVGLDLVPGTVALVCVIIGTTTFDGASNGSLWRNLAPHLYSFFGNGTLGVELGDTVGLAACVAIVSSFYRLGILGMRSVSHRFGSADLAGRFAHTLAPIAFAYILAHYFSLLVFQGQAIGYLISDPLGHGSNLFGTAHFQINSHVFSDSAIWYVQVVALVSGHVAGLVLAHDRALVIFPRVREAVRSQYWMLTVMVGFTCLGLWLLSAVST